MNYNGSNFIEIFPWTLITLQMTQAFCLFSLNTLSDNPFLHGSEFLCWVLHVYGCKREISNCLREKHCLVFTLNMKKEYPSSIMSFPVKIAFFGTECYSGLLTKYYSLMPLHCMPRCSAFFYLVLPLVVLPLVIFSIIFILNHLLIIHNTHALLKQISSLVLNIIEGPNDTICLNYHIRLKCFSGHWRSLLRCQDVTWIVREKMPWRKIFWSMGKE